MSVLCYISVFGRCSLRISAGKTAVVTEAFSDCAQTLLSPLHMEENNQLCLDLDVLKYLCFTRKIYPSTNLLNFSV
jgi:hypothetical protein